MSTKAPQPRFDALWPWTQGEASCLRNRTQLTALLRAYWNIVSLTRWIQSDNYFIWIKKKEKKPPLYIDCGRWAWRLIRNTIFQKSMLLLGSCLLLPLWFSTVPPLLINQRFFLFFSQLKLKNNLIFFQCWLLKDPAEGAVALLQAERRGGDWTTSQGPH